ncbi:hypothetical protein MVEN_01627800 [Mycena venus]|uniref:DUF6535 domain-containing protein n=1 Tax=Mycena venus TaxID=2733690 RepID=A0A8H6XQL0_9AGAR|nr:hypothetical protein MVEN_01627800 [Mycena venus]
MKLPVQKSGPSISLRRRNMIRPWSMAGGGDMEGILIFAGLFSAILTAFIIESYKTLNPDSGRTTVLLLAQILRTLSPDGNGTSVEVPHLSEFSPPPISVVCNSLWFLSLSLSLSSALVATLIEQWARNFLQRTEMRSSPVVRARIFSYLYYGMKRFNMHTVVELVPLLLHSSLFLFFSGLVAFLLPINMILAALVGGVLTVVATIYTCLTILPVLYHDCPFWTPMSSGFWRARRILSPLLWAPLVGTRDPEKIQTSFDTTIKVPETIVESMISFATLDSPERTERDARALCWTSRSLVDDDELEPFLEGIPDLIHDPANHRRYVYDERIRFLVQDPEVQLGSRMANLIHMSDSGLLAPAVQTRRVISCLKAMWAIARLAEKDSYPQPFDSIQETHLFSNFIRRSPSLTHYSASAVALVGWSRLCSRTACINRALQMLKECEQDGRSTRAAKVAQTVQHLRVLLPHWPYPAKTSTNSQATSSWIMKTITEVRSMKDSVRHKPLEICLQFLTDCSFLDTLPYQFDKTWDRFKGEISAPADYGLPIVEQIYERLSLSHSIMFNDPSVHDFDKLLGVLFPLWQRFTSGNSTFVRHLVSYINSRTSDDAVYYALRGCEKSLSSCLLNGLRNNNENDLLIATFRLLRFPRMLNMDCSYSDKSSLDALHSVAASPVSLSVASLVRHSIIHSICEATDAALAFLDRGNEGLYLDDPPLSTETTRLLEQHQITQSKCIDQLRSEACLINVSHFLNHCRSSLVPYKSRETLSVIGDFAPRTPIDPTHQRYFARSLRDLVSQADVLPCRDLVEELICSKLLAVYAHTAEDVSASPMTMMTTTEGETLSRSKYLDDVLASGMVVDALELFFKNSPAQPTGSPKTQEIIRALKSQRIPTGGT